MKKIHTIKIAILAAVIAFLPVANVAAVYKFTGTVNQYDIPSNPSNTVALSPGGDGNMWFLEQGENYNDHISKVSRITSNGTITEFEIPGHPRRPNDLATDKAGNLWFTESDDSRIGKMTINGTVTQFDLPDSITNPNKITLGPDGSMWFTTNGQSIGRIAANGDVDTFALPNGITFLADIAGSNQYVWATAPAAGLGSSGSSSNHVLRISSDGTIETFETEDPQNGYVDSVATDKSGSAWYIHNNNLIGKISPSGDVNEYSTDAVSVRALDVGPDGDMWFSAQEDSGNLDPSMVIKSISTSGRVTSRYSFSDTNTQIDYLKFGKDNNLWFVNTAQNRIGVLRFNEAGATSGSNVNNEDSDDTDKELTATSTVPKAPNTGVPRSQNFTPFYLISGGVIVGVFVYGLRHYTKNRR